MKHMQKHMQDNRPDKCPGCGSSHVAEIMYGLPRFCNNEQWKAVHEGRVVLGGCCVSSDSPRWYCHDCKHRWGRHPIADR